MLIQNNCFITPEIRNVFTGDIEYIYVNREESEKLTTSIGKVRERKENKRDEIRS